jgi:hypothetical protein
MLTASLYCKVLHLLIHLKVELASPEAKYRASRNDYDDDDDDNMIDSILSRISQVRSRGIDGGQNGFGVGFFESGFPCQF